MKKNRRNDLGAQEVIGFILTFFLSSVVLLLSLSTFTTTRQSTQDVQAAAEFQLLANRVAGVVTRASQDAESMPNATLQSTVWIPRIPNVEYYVNLTDDYVWVNSTDGKFHANSTTFRLSGLGAVTIGGRSTAAGGLLKVCYWLDDLGDQNPTNDVRNFRVRDAGQGCR